MKHKYIEALNKNLLWEHRNSLPTRRFGFKGFMCSAWRGQDHRNGGKWIDLDELSKMKKGKQQNSEGIEDVEQSAFDKLLDGGIYDQLRATSRIWLTSANNAMNPLASSSTTQNEKPNSPTFGQEGPRRRIQLSQNQQASESAQEYEIDPITNRKVPKNKSSESTRQPIDVPVKTFKGYRSQFQGFPPPASQPTDSNVKTSNPPPESSSGSAVNISKSPPDRTRESLEDYERHRQYRPYFRYEPDGQRSESMNECLGEYDRKSSYETSRWYEPEVVKAPPEKECLVQQGLKEYDDKVTYGPVLYLEPDGKPPEKKSDGTRESLEEYEKRHPVGPVFYREPDGKPPEKKSDGTRESLEEYESRHPVGPVFYREPDGKSPEKKSDGTRESLEEYEIRHPIGPVMYREPDGKLPEKPCPVQEGLKEYDSKVTYGDERRSAPKQDSAAGSLRDFAKGVNYYRTRIMKNVFLGPGSGSADKSFRYPNEDTKEDMDLLRPSDVRAASGIIKDAKKESDADKLAMRSKLEEDFQKQQDKTMEDLKIETSELRNIQAHLQGRVKAELANVSADLSSQSPRRKMTGNFVQDFPEEFETRWTPAQDSGALKPENDPPNQEVRESAPKASFSRDSNTPRIQTSLDRTAANKHEKARADEMSIIQNEIDPYSKEPQGLETSYAEDVKIRNEIDAHSKKPIGLESSYAGAAQQAEGDLSVRASSLGKGNEAEEDTRASKLAKQERKNLMKQKDKELIREIRSIYEEKYGTLDAKHRQVPESPAATEQVVNSESIPEAQEPTVYKILAYDPTMQEINTADTTSIVSDSASALTPAEVLLRLSNPAKFFPHFQPLQAQGYEIVSGSGDVLVFRKVRAAGPQGSSSRNESASAIQDRNNKRKTTNPIDGMQSSPIAATGNFASPTGFVNHDLPVADPPFKSNIDVRREEPVFSGKSNWQEESESPRRKGKGRGKRLLIGAAWVAGCSYAVGVVAEFFRTGGMDGRGPQGF